jgi:hypothetical protein
VQIAGHKASGLFEPINLSHQLRISWSARNARNYRADFFRLGLVLLDRRATPAFVAVFELFAVRDLPEAAMPSSWVEPKGTTTVFTIPPLIPVTVIVWVPAVCATIPVRNVLPFTSC